MVTYIKNNFGFITSFIEWQVLNGQGQFEDNAENIYIQDIWIHPKYRRIGVIGKLANMIMEDKFAINAKRVYWVRHKYNDRKSVYIIKHILDKLGAKNGFEQEFYASKS